MNAEFEWQDVQEWVRSHIDVVTFCGLGIIMAGIGVVEWRRQQPRTELIQVEQSFDESLVEGGVVVDVAGAVNRPGIYRLEAGSRINQALEAAGGFSEDADAEWIASQLNLASMINDGSKIYIPSKNAGNHIDTSTTSSVASQQATINVNSANLEQLKTLKGVGEVRASDIINNRPYSNFEDLKVKAGLGDKIIEDNREKIVFY